MLCLMCDWIVKPAALSVCVRVCNRVQWPPSLSAHIDKVNSGFERTFD